MDLIFSTDGCRIQPRCTELCFRRFTENHISDQLHAKPIIFCCFVHHFGHFFGTFSLHEPPREVFLPDFSPAVLSCGQFLPVKEIPSGVGSVTNVREMAQRDASEPPSCHSRSPATILSIPVRGLPFTLPFFPSQPQRELIPEACTDFMRRCPPGCLVGGVSTGACDPVPRCNSVQTSDTPVGRRNRHKAHHVLAIQRFPFVQRLSGINLPQ